MWIGSTTPFRFFLAKYYMENGQNDKALAIYKKIVRKENLGLSSAKLIRKFLTNRQKNMPLLSEVHFNFGQIYLQKKMWHETTEEFRKSLKLGNTFYKEIQSELLKISEAYPDLEYIHYFLGEICQRENKMDSAIKEYKTVIKLVPNHIDALKRLNKVYESTGLTKEAEVLKEKIIELIPQHRTERNFQNKILFLGYDLKKHSTSDKGSNFLITFYFRLLEPVNEDVDIYLHLNNSVTLKSVINTTMHFAEGRPNLWKRKQVVRKTYSFLIPTKSSLADYFVQVGLWDHKQVLGYIEINNLSL